MTKTKVLLVGGTGLIGSHIMAKVNEREVQIYAPSSSELNLRLNDSVSSFFSKIIRDEGKGTAFDYLVYSALDKDKENFEETNLDNMKRLLHYSSFFNRWLHLSSRAVYDGFCSYHKISAVPLSQIPNTFDNPYSSLKYKEELILSNAIPNDSVILRVFDISLQNDYSDIIQRWFQQIKNKGKCRNEILSPITISEFCRILYKILSMGIAPGTYNVSGYNTISSGVIMKERGLSSFLEKEEKEKTGLSSF